MAALPSPFGRELYNVYITIAFANKKKEKPYGREMLKQLSPNYVCKIGLIQQFS
jgi:hypothetical protein